jgi:hypothetical protein
LLIKERFHRVKEGAQRTQRKKDITVLLAQKAVFSVASFYLCALYGIVTQFPRTASMVFLGGVEIISFSKLWNQIREAAERGTIPQRKGGYTEDTERERYSLPAMLAQKKGFPLCPLFTSVTSVES